jgi:hypothetical protein
MRIHLRACFAMLLAVQAVRVVHAAPKATTATLKKYDSPVYIVYTDVAEEDAKEAIIRMNKMAYEYHERTKNLFSGQISSPLPFYLYSNPQDYVAASQMPGSAGIFTGDSLMAMALKGQDGHVSSRTWHVVQHEGFHQFVFAVIRGDIPTWVNEGLAEYFGEAVFTGDGMVTGVVPDYRMKRVQKEIADGQFITIERMMTMSHKEWNANLEITHYDQAWSMVHFLATAEKGKYQDAFAKFLQLIGKGNPWEKAWVGAFGSVAGFEQKWKDYWTQMPENATLDLFAKATVASLTSFLARSFSQKDTFDNFDEYIRHEAKNLKAAPADWLPPALYTEMKARSEALQNAGCKFSFLRTKGPIPQLVCVMEDGTKVIGTFTLNNGRVGMVKAEIVKK